MTVSSIRHAWYSRTVSLCLVFTFMMTMVITPKVANAQGVPGLPEPGAMVNLSSAYMPLNIIGLTVHPENPLRIDFILNTGNSKLTARDASLKQESIRLIKYFLATLATPENDLWVNLSPYEKQRIITDELGKTELGRDMLEQDYILKQLTASLIYPEKNLGRNFWDSVYAKAQQMYGTTQIPVNTFNKVWILPDSATVYTHQNTVILVQSHLKVMLDEDYLSLNKHENSSVILSEAKDLNRINSLRDSSATPQNDMHRLGSQMVRQLILPAIEKEVNTGANFATLRQIYSAMILATWYRSNLKQALLNQVYTNQKKINGVNVSNNNIKEEIYKQYLEAYKKGVFNYIKEESADASKGTTIARKYFSGGLVAPSSAMIVTTTNNQVVENFIQGESGSDVAVRSLTPPSNAMTAGEAKGKLKVQAEYFAMLDAKYSSKSSNQVLHNVINNLDGIIKNLEGVEIILKGYQEETQFKDLTRNIERLRNTALRDIVAHHQQEGIAAPLNRSLLFGSEGFLRLNAAMTARSVKRLQESVESFMQDVRLREFSFKFTFAPQRQDIALLPPADEKIKDGEILEYDYLLGTEVSSEQFIELIKGIMEKRKPVVLQLPNWGELQNKVKSILGDTKISQAMTSAYHEQLAQQIFTYSNENNGATPMPTHAIEKMFRVEDVPLNLMNLDLEQKKELWSIAWSYLRELSARNGHIAWGPMVGGSASRMAKDKLPQILIDALKEAPDQFVDRTRFTPEENELIKTSFGGDYRAFIRSLNPDIEAQHEVLDRVLYEAKALLPADRPINGVWYNLLGYNAINVKRANDMLQKQGLNRVFILKLLANDGNYNKILQDLVRNNFYGLKVSVIKDGQGNVVDIDHSDVNNEIVIYNQRMGYRIAASVKTVVAQWAIDKGFVEKAATETGEARVTSLGKAQLKSEAAYQYALAFAQANEGKVLYNSSAVEGHGERFHALFETTSVGTQIPMIIQDILRNVEYDYFHNIDNMANLNDDWMLIFGYMLKNNLLMTLEGSLRPSTERGGGGGFDWTYIGDGHGGEELVYRQTEDNVTKASLGKDAQGNLISPHYNQKVEDERAAKIINRIPNQVPVNNASELNKVLTLDTLVRGDDIISVNMTAESREELAVALKTALETKNYKIDLKKFSNAEREAFGVVSTIKSVADPNVKKPTKDQVVLTVVPETFAWSSEEGALRGQRMHVILTPSIVDVNERGYSPEAVRFDPLKDRPTYDNPLAQSVRGALLKYVVLGNIFSPDFINSNNAMTTLTDDEKSVLVKQIEEMQHKGRVEIFAGHASWNFDLPLKNESLVNLFIINKLVRNLELTPEYTDHNNDREFRFKYVDFKGGADPSNKKEQLHKLVNHELEIIKQSFSSQAMTTLNKGLTEALKQLGIESAKDQIQEILVDSMNVDVFLTNLEKLYKGTKTKDYLKSQLINGGLLSRDGQNVTTEIFDQNSKLLMFKNRIGNKEIYLYDIQKAMSDAIDVKRFLKSFPAGQRSAVAEVLAKSGGDNDIFGVFKSSGIQTLGFTADPVVNDKGNLNYTFGTSGIRFSWEQLRKQNPRIIQGLADYLKSIGVDKIIVGRDTRHGNIDNVKEAASILAANGIEVVMVGLDEDGGFSLEGALPTPVIALATKIYKGKGSINYTASHNPAVDDGLKFSPEDGGAASKKITDGIQKFINDDNLVGYKTMDYREAIKQGLIQEIKTSQIIAEYVQYFEDSLKSVKDNKGNTLWDNLVAYIKNKPDELFLYNSLQGTSGAVANQILKRVAQAAGVNEDFYAIHHGNPSSDFEEVGGKPNVQNLIGKAIDYTDPRGRTMTEVAADGDADRFSWRDEQGRTIIPDEILAVLIFFLSTQVDSPESNDIIKTFVTSDYVKAVVDYLNEHRGKFLRLHDTAAGYKYIADYLRAGFKVKVGGEDSYHTGIPSIFKDTWDDAIGGALMALVIKSMLKDVPDLQDKTLAGYIDYIRSLVPQYTKITADTIRTFKDEEDKPMLKAVKELIGVTYQQIDRNVPMQELTVIKKFQEFMNQEFSSAGVPVPEIDSIQIEYKGPNDSYPAVRDGIQIRFKTGDRAIERPSGTEPVGKGYVDAKVAVNAQPLKASIIALTNWAKAEFVAGRLKIDPAMLETVQSDDEEVSPSDAAMARSNDLHQEIAHMFRGYEEEGVSLTNEKLARAGGDKQNQILSEEFDRMHRHFFEPSLKQSSLRQSGDTAMNGGIDLNAKHLNLHSEGDKVNITFEPAMIAQFRRGDFSGVQIKIIDVEPINLLPMLGLKKEDLQVA